jgi:hypothetical protein
VLKIGFPLVGDIHYAMLRELPSSMNVSIVYLALAAVVQKPIWHYAVCNRSQNVLSLCANRFVTLIIGE